ncbi:MAG TPA: tetratricopeptide repeat protein, partial [Candidatus Nanoarchaeia archaeon]|nr:tetratricopeptide repeat protein [Candidatus Nanoarchaeia archaeon]
SMDSNKIQLWRRITTLENLPFVLLTLLILLVPAFFAYSKFVSFLFTKSLLISLGVLLSFVLSILVFIKRGALPYPKGLVPVTFGGLVLAYLFSTIFSTSPVSSFLGYGYEATTFSFFLIMFVLTYLVSITFNSPKKIFTAYSALLVVTGVLGAFHSLRFFLGDDFLSLGIFDTVVANTIGKFNEVGIFFGVAVLICLFALEILKLKAVHRIVVCAVLAVSLFMLVVVNFTSIWYAIAAVAAVFFVYSAAHSTTHVEQPVAQGQVSETPRRRIAIMSLVIAIIALFFVLPVGRDLGSNLGARFGVSNVEVRPSWGATFDVFKGNIKADPVFGAGPNRFGVAWQMYRPDVNLTNFWGTNFDSAIGYIPTSIIETGLVGILAWLGFIFSIGWLGLRALFSNYADQLSRYLVISSLGVVAFLWAMSVVYSPGTVIVFLTFTFTGLFVAATSVSRVTSVGEFSFIKYPKIGFVVTMLCVFVLIASAGLGYTVFEQVRASMHFQKALAAINTENNVAGAENFLVNALNLSERDLFYRSIAELNIAKVSAIIASANGKTEVSDEERDRFQGTIASALEAAKLAQKSDPFKVENQLIVARVYDTILPVGVEGAYDASKAAYDEALKVSPRNPGIYLAMAQAAAANRDLETAQAFNNEALKLKPNYIDAIFFQA